MENNDTRTVKCRRRTEAADVDLERQIRNVLAEVHPQSVLHVAPHDRSPAAGRGRETGDGLSRCPAPGGGDAPLERDSLWLDHPCDRQGYIVDSCRGAGAGPQGRRTEQRVYYRLEDVHVFGHDAWGGGDG